MESKPAGVTGGLQRSGCARVHSLCWPARSAVILILLVAAVLTPTGIAAATNDAAAALQKGLFEEEANHDFNAAIQAYQAVIKQFDQERKLAATAVFRLGECYRKQGHTNEANAQYERVVREFSDQAPLVTLSRSYLAAAGQTAVAQPAGPAPTTSEELNELAEVRRIKAMIKDSPDLINARDGLGRTPLHRAAESGQVQVATFLLENGAEVNARNNAGETPLLLATRQGRKSMMELLLSHGADVNAAQYDPGAPTALDVAAGKGYRSLVELLLAHGAKLTPVAPNGVTPLHLAAVNGFKSVAEVLIQHGADVNALVASVRDPDSPRTYTGTPLHIAAAHGDQAMAELLLDSKADPNLKTEDGTTPLFLAAQSGHDAVAKLLIDHGADINARNNMQMTPLAGAVLNQQVATAKALLAAKADPNLTFQYSNAKPRTALFSAVPTKNVELVRLLLDHGANPNVEDETEQTTPLCLAARLQLKDIAALLLHAKADPNTHDPYGQTPLHFAVAEPATAELLLADKADANAQDRQGDTPLHWAAGAGLKPAAELLLAHGADINARDKEGDTPLALAVLGRRTEMTDFLLAKGANPNVANLGGFTPLTWLKNDSFAVTWTQIGNNASFPRPYQPSRPGIGPPMSAIPMSGPVQTAFYPGGPPSSQQSSRETRDALAAALKSHGALEDLPHLDRIEVNRPDANYSAPIFFKGTNDWNHFTALDVLGVAYGLLTGNPDGETGSTAAESLWARAQDLPFPDFAQLRLRRPEADLKTWQERKLDLQPVLQSGDCSKNVTLDWGEVVQVPEADHPLNQRWTGFSEKELTNLVKCLSRQVTVVIKGQATKLVVGPDVEFYSGPVPAGAAFGDRQAVKAVNSAVSQMTEPKIITKAPVWLKPVLQRSNLLLTSSDLSRVTVTRIDKTSGEKHEWVLDCSGSQHAPAFWLRDGDVIEVPEKP